MAVRISTAVGLLTGMDLEILLESSGLVSAIIFNLSTLFEFIGLLWGRGSRGSCMRSMMVPLDRALLSSYRLFFVTISLSVKVWPQFAVQILTGGCDPQISPFHGVTGAPV